MFGATKSLQNVFFPLAAEALLPQPAGKRGDLGQALPPQTPSLNSSLAYYTRQT
jgi:hypothetical protein